MKKIFLILITVCCQTILFAQDAKQLHDNAKDFMHKGDYSNAILILNRALLIQPANLEIHLGSDGWCHAGREIRT